MKKENKLHNIVWYWSMAILIVNGALSILFFATDNILGTFIFTTMTVVWVLFLVWKSKMDQELDEVERQINENWKKLGGLRKDAIDLEEEYWRKVNKNGR